MCIVCMEELYSPPVDILCCIADLDQYAMGNSGCGLIYVLYGEYLYVHIMYNVLHMHTHMH